MKTGPFDDAIEGFIADGLSDDEIARAITDRLVQEAQAAFMPVWDETDGNDGYVSFELDPLLEDPQQNLPHEERVAGYVTLGKWQENRDFCSDKGLALDQEIIFASTGTKNPEDGSSAHNVINNNVHRLNCQGRHV